MSALDHLGRQFQRPAIVQQVRDERQDWRDRQSDTDMWDRTHWSYTRDNDESHTGPDSDSCPTCQSWRKK